MQPRFFDRHKTLKDTIGIIVFVIGVLIGTLIINAFIFRSFNVEGFSMEKTLDNGDRLIVNRLPVTLAQIQNKPYIPKRGQIIVFRNPHYNYIDSRDEYIVKRVIALPGERIVLKDGHYTVYNPAHPTGFNPDDYNHGEPGTPTSEPEGPIDEVVPSGTIFVSGDHRQGSCSEDSRYKEMGTIPLYDIVGPVGLRIFPFNKVRAFGAASSTPDAAGKQNPGNGRACEGTA